MYDIKQKDRLLFLVRYCYNQLFTIVEANFVHI